MKVIIFILCNLTLLLLLSILTYMICRSIIVAFIIFKDFIKEKINLWKNFKKQKPKENGWYITTVEVDGQQRYVMHLYWYQNIGDDGKWSESIWDRTADVVAWKKEPKPFMKGFVKPDHKTSSKILRDKSR